MPPASIRSASSQSKMATAPLHSIIVDSHAQSSAIRKYFQIKRDLGSLALPKPVLNGSVLAELSQKLENTSDQRTTVQCVILCLEEFTSNSQCEEPWQSFHKEIVQLTHNCCSFFVRAKRDDIVQKTTVFDSAIKSFSKLCDVIDFAASGNVPFSTLFFQVAASDLFGLMHSQNLKPSVCSIILATISTLCVNADKACVIEIFRPLHMLLRAVARKIFDFDAKGQVDAYIILRSSISNIEEAKERMCAWFTRFPELQKAFLSCFDTSLLEGAGLFASKLFDLRDHVSSRAVKSLRIVSASTGHSGAVLDTQTKCLNQTDPYKCAQSSPMNKGQFGKSLKGIQTPYYPDRRISQSMLLKENLKNDKCAQIQTAENLPATNRQIQSKKWSPQRSFVGSLDPREQCKPKLPSSRKVDFINFSQSRKRSTESNLLSGTHKRNQHTPVESQIEMSILGLKHEDKTEKVQRWLESSGYISTCSDKDNQLVTRRNNVDEFQLDNKNVAFKRPSSEIPGSCKLKRERLAVTETSGRNIDGLTRSQAEMNKGKHDSLRQVSRKNCGSLVREIEEVNVSSDDEEPIFEDTKGKPKPTLYSKVCHESSPVKGTKPSMVFRAENLWEKKLRQLEEEHKRQREEEVKKRKGGSTSHDIYSFSCLLPESFQKREAPKDPCATKKSASSSKKLDRKVLLPKPLRGKTTFNKENLPPGNVKPSVKTKLTSSYTKKEELTTENHSRGQAKKFQPDKTFGCFSPLIDDSLEAPESEDISRIAKVSKFIKDECKSDAILPQKADSGSLKINNTANLSSGKCVNSSVPNLTSPTMAKPNPYHVKLRGKLSKDTLLPSNVCDHTHCVSLNQKAPLTNFVCVDSPIRGRIEGAKLEKDKLTSVPNLKSSTPNLKCKAERSGDVDSGLDLTSDHSGTSKIGSSVVPCQKKESARSVYLKLRMQELISSSLNANKEMSKNQSDLTSEMLNIKGLADKITASVKRCEAVGSSQQELLSGQAASLQKSSRHCESLETQFGTTVNPSEFVRQLKAKNTERIITAMKTVLENHYSLSSSDSE